MQQLLDADLVIMTGDRGSARYQLSARLTQAHGDIGVSHSSVNGTRDERVLAVAQQPVSVAEIQAALGLSKAQARYTLDKMRNQGLIEVVGDSPRNTKYVAKEGPAHVRD